MRDGSTADPARLLRLCFACCVLLAGCNETTGSVQEPIHAVTRPVAADPNISPRGAAVALTFTGVEGVPSAIVSQFSGAFARAAEIRELTLAEPKLANYFVQLHLTAYAAGHDTTALAYVSDVFDGKKHRTQRLGDAFILKGAAPDAWSLVDGKSVEAIAARSAEDLAAFLSNTPEAVAAANAPAGNTRAAALPRSGRAPIALSPDVPAAALGFSAVR